MTTCLETPGAGLPAFMLFAAKGARRAKLKAREARIIGAIESGAALIGAPLLEATSPEDLDVRIDLALESGQLLRFDQRFETYMGDNPTSMRAEVGKDAKALEKAIVQFFPRAPALARKAAWHSLHMVDAYFDLRKHVPDDASDMLAEFIAAAPGGPLGFLTDPAIPTPVAKAFYGGLRSGVCVLAVAHVMSEQIELRPWLQHALLDRWFEGQSELLRFLASTGLVDVSEDVVPASERLDFAALEKTVQRRMKHYASLPVERAEV